MSIFYRLVRFVFSIYNQLYFRRFKVVGKENIPHEGAILFSPNHQKCIARPTISRELLLGNQFIPLPEVMFLEGPAMVS